MYILIFKTTLYKISDIEAVRTIFINNSDIIDWSVDLEDIDKVLRIESKRNNPKTIRKNLDFIGIKCSEL